jgi:hypothetical protein
MPEPSKKKAARSIIPGKNPKTQGTFNRAAFVLRRGETIPGSIRVNIFEEKIFTNPNRTFSMSRSIHALEIAEIGQKLRFFS